MMLLICFGILAVFLLTHYFFRYKFKGEHTE